MANMITNPAGHPLPLAISKQRSPRPAPSRCLKTRSTPTSIVRHKLKPVGNQDEPRDHEKPPQIASEDRLFPLDQNTNHQSRVSQEDERSTMQTSSNMWRRRRRRSGRQHCKDEEEEEEEEEEAQIDLTRQSSKLLASTSWKQSSSKRRLVTSRLCLLTALLFAFCHLSPIQHENQVNCLQTQFGSMTNTNQNSNDGNKLNLDGLLAAESRAAGDNLGQLRPPLVVGPGGSNPSQAALNQLVSFLNSINNQQQGTNNNSQRRSPAVQPLPLGAMGNQRQMGQPQPVSSTPVNPFVAAVNFQPTRRQQVQSTNLQFPLQNSQPQNAPALTLNRIASQFNNNNNQLVAGVAINRFTNSQQLPNFNLNSNNLNNGNSRAVNTNTSNGGAANPPVPSRNAPVRPAQSPFANQNTNPLRSLLMPPPSSLMTTTAASTTLSQQPRPISGFAPSGPPPSAASNNAINVVQSPANAIGSPSGQMMTPFDMPLLSSNSNNRPILTTNEPTTTTTTTMPASTASESTATTSQATTIANSITATTTTSAPIGGPPQAQTTTTSLVASSEPASQTATAASSSASSPSSTPTDQEQAAANSSWNPVQQAAANRTRQSSSTTSSSLAPTPDIVTVPPGYNPDQPAPPQSYDIAVSAQMGPSNSNNSRAEPSITRVALVEPTPTLSVLAMAAPTETTTIIWSSEASAIATLAAPTSVRIQPTRTQLPGGATMSSLPTATTTSSSGTPASSSSPPQRIRDSSQVMMQNDEAHQQQADAGIVYGKAASRESSAKPSRPPASSDQQQSGRPFIQTAQLDTQVRPYSAQAPQLLAKSNHAGPSSGHLPFKPSKPLNGPGGSMGGGGGGGSGAGMSVGSGFSIVASGNQTMPTGDIQDYVAGAPPPIVSVGSSSSPHSQEPTISAQGGPDPATLDLEASSSSSSSSGAVAASEQPAGSSTQVPAATPRLRRPTFKPKPAVPPIRIDSCIVGDDSSCDQSHNERCVTEYGISSCHCKPGFARLSQLRGYCSPVSLLQLSLKIDRLADDRKLAYNQTLENPNTEEYQYLEFETIQALASALQQTSLAKQFMGARVNKFFAHKNKVWANMSLNLESNNVTRSEGRIQQLAQQELSKLLAQRQPLGDSTILLDGSRESISKLVDINECANRDLNDCSKHATCTNEFGGYSCQCLAGYEDKAAAAMMTNQSDSSQQDQADKQLKLRAGRVCMGCSPAYCSNRGECFIQDGRKQCKCRANFMGARCDIDSEVLAVAVGGALIGFTILIVSVWCLVVYNRRLRRDQHKMDAISATSGLTYNYVNGNGNGNGNLNSSTNSLMSPLASATAARHHPLTGLNTGRSAGGGYTMGGRFGSRGAQYQADQQAIIGSTSSGSSAASQPIACNPYAASAGYPYDEGLLIAPASTGSSEQTSPSANSYRGIMGASNSNHSAAMLAAAGNAYTLSGHHYHHHHHHQQQQQQQQQQAAAAAAYHHQQQHLLQQHALAAHQQMHQHQHHHHQHHQQGKQLTQFHPSALMDSYATRTLNTGANAAGNYCPASQQTANGYDSRWRTLAADNSTKQSSLAGYYLVR